MLHIVLTAPPPYGEFDLLTHLYYLRLSVCPFVRSFVRLLPTCERYLLKTNEPMSMQIGTNLPRVKGMNDRRRGQVTGQGHRKPKLSWKP